MNKKINERVAYYRKKAGLTQKDVAVNLGITTSNFQQKESKGNFKIEELKELAMMFDVPIMTLLYSEEENNGVDKVLNKIEGNSLAEMIRNTENKANTVNKLESPKTSNFDNPYTIKVNRRENQMFSMYQSLRQKDKEEVYEFIKDKFYKK